MATTVTIADDLASQLRPYSDSLTEIIELGIREWKARTEPGYNGISQVFETLAALPTPEEVLALRPAPPLQERIEVLLEKSRTTDLSAEDQREWDQYSYLEHIVRMAKANALRKLKGNGA